MIQNNRKQTFKAQLKVELEETDVYGNNTNEPVVNDLRDFVLPQDYWNSYTDETKAKYEGHIAIINNRSVDDLKDILKW